jgi:hypothetical protein
MILGVDQFREIMTNARALPCESRASFLERVTVLLRQHRPDDAEVAAALKAALSAELFEELNDGR